MHYSNYIRMLKIFVWFHVAKSVSGSWLEKCIICICGNRVLTITIRHFVVQRLKGYTFHFFKIDFGIVIFFYTFCICNWAILCCWKFNKLIFNAALEELFCNKILRVFSVCTLLNFQLTECKTFWKNKLWQFKMFDLDYRVEIFWQNMVRDFWHAIVHLVVLN